MGEGSKNDHDDRPSHKRRPGKRRITRGMQGGMILQRHAQPKRLLVVLCTLIAFLFQAYTVQTHVHPLPAHAAAAAGKPDHNTQKPGKGTDDPDDCPICQAFALAGSFVAPPAILLPMATARLLAVAEPVSPPKPVRRVHSSWQSRAPPRA